jgi:hypothetical protein
MLTSEHVHCLELFREADDSATLHYVKFIRSWKRRQLILCNILETCLIVMHYGLEAVLSCIKNFPLERIVNWNKLSPGTDWPPDKNFLGTDDPVEQMILWNRLSFDKWSRGTDYSVEQAIL